MLRTTRNLILLAAIILSPAVVHGQLTLDQVTPGHGATGVPNGTDITLQFSEAVDVAGLQGIADDLLGLVLGVDLSGLGLEIDTEEIENLPGVAFAFNPPVDFTGMQWSSDFRELTLQGATFEEDTVHSLITLFAVGVSGAPLRQIYVHQFSTGGHQAPTGSVIANVNAPAADQAGSLVIAVPKDLFDISLEEELTITASFGSTDPDGNVDLRFLAPADYLLFAVGNPLVGLDFDNPQIPPLALGGVDADGNGVADVVTVGTGQVTGVNLNLSTNIDNTFQSLQPAAETAVEALTSDAGLALGAIAGLNEAGEGSFSAYLFTSPSTGLLYYTLSAAGLVTPAFVADLGPAFSGFLIPIGDPAPNGSDFAMNTFLSAGGDAFLANYPDALGSALLMERFLFDIVLLFIPQLSDLLTLLGEPAAKTVVDRFGEIPVFEQALTNLGLGKSELLGGVWITGFLSFDLAGHLVAADASTGEPLLVVGSSPMSASRANAVAAAESWRNDATLVNVSTDFIPLDHLGNALAWYYRFAAGSQADSIYVVPGSFGTPLFPFSMGVDEVDLPSTAPLPRQYLDSPAALDAAENEAAAFIATHTGILVSAELSSSFPDGNPQASAIWRFTFNGVNADGETEEKVVDIDAVTGIFVDVEELAELPEGYVLGQNYPNPFNPETRIPYRVSEAGDVSLEVYNAIGQRVRTLMRSHQAAGEYSLRFDARNDAGEVLPSGTYIYRLTSGDAVLTRAMTLLR